LERSAEAFYLTKRIRDGQSLDRFWLAGLLRVSFFGESGQPCFSGAASLFMQPIQSVLHILEADVGVHPKEVQEIMRNKDYVLTVNRYGRSLDGYKRPAVNELPRFARKDMNEKSA